MKRLQSIFVLALLLALIFSSLSAESFVYAQTQDQAKFTEKIKRIEKFVEMQMRSEETVGLTVGFIKDDFVWVKGFGFADLENRLPAKIESSYRMASVTKPMTAMGILRLVEEGKINLDDEVQKYVPYFPKKKYPVTVRQLLGHLGGISHYQNYNLEGHFKDHKNTREAIAVFENFDLIAEPGTQYNYSSYGFNLLGAVIEGASGKSYGEYMTENVWKPLGMKDTLMDDPLAIIPNRVKGYQMINGKIKNSEFVDISSRFAGGGTRSTIPDLLNFAKNLYEGKLLSDKTRSEMWTAQSTRGGRNIGYGYGWGTNTANGRFVVGHGGAQAEARTYVLAVPHQKFAAAVAINFENADSAAYVTKIFEIIMDEPWSIRMFSRDQKYADTLRGMDSAFDFGMRYYDQFGKPQTTDANELKSAFAYFNETLKMPKDEALPRFQKGSHPASKEAFVKMVSYIAEKLKQNGKNLDDYYDRGVIPLFADYINWYKTQPNYSADLKFESTFEQQIAKWNADWAKTWNDETRELEIFASTDFKALGESLSKTFSGASVYPDFVNDLDNQVVSLATAGNFEKAFEVGQLNYKLYPDSDKSNATLGTLYVLAGQKDKAMPLLKKSLEINPRGDASAGSLNGTAYNLLNINQPEAGLQLLLIAVELHPKEANLFDSLGEFYMNLKQNDKAIEYYLKALEINPNYPNAKVAKETLEKLKNK
jgi:CubicO group peptidase (beta-lactamase class C family)/tetratricopeptide (TPR) repeat protein